MQPIFHRVESPLSRSRFVAVTSVPARALASMILVAMATAFCASPAGAGGSGVAGASRATSLRRRAPVPKAGADEIAPRADVAAAPAAGTGVSTPKRPLIRDLAVRTDGAKAAETAGNARVKVAIDPVSGAVVRPAPGQLRELGIESLRRAQGPPLIVRLLDGSTIAYLDDRYMSYWIARADGAGNLRSLCVDGAEAAARALRPGAPPPAAPAAKADR